MNDMPTDILTQIDGFVASGCEPPEASLLQALTTLADRDSDLAGICEGLADESAGRVAPARDVLAAGRMRHSIA